MTDVNISTHSNIYYDAKIPHKVVFIDYTIKKPKTLKNVGDTKILIRYITDPETPEKIRGDEIILKYNVTEQVIPLIKALYNYVEKYNPAPSSKLSPLITLDIVNLKDKKGMHFSYNLIKDNDKLVFSLITQSIEVDGDSFPQTVIPLLITLSKSFNYMRPETKEHMLKLLLEVHKNFVNTQYFMEVFRHIPKEREQTVVYHMALKVIPQIIRDIESGSVTVKKRNVDSIVSIQRNTFSKVREWSLMFINFKGSVNVPMVVNKKIVFTPRRLGGEAVKVPLNFIGVDEMYGNIVPDNLMVKNKGVVA